MEKKPVEYNEAGLNVEAITWALKALKERRADIVEARKFYDGDHPLAFASEKFRNAFGATFGAIKINLCEMVVDTYASRFKISGFNTKLKKGQKQKRDTISEAADEIWEMNRMDARWRDLATEAIKCGEAYLIVWPDKEADNEVVWYPQDADQCAVKYHEEKPGFIVQAAKSWLADDGKIRLTIYFADRLEKYVTGEKVEAMPEQAAAFKRYEPDGEEWPLANRWDKCPVFHFPRGRKRNSILKNLIGPQNGLNKTECDKMVSMEFFAQPQRWGIGIEEESEDDTEAAEVWKSAADRLWTVANDNAKFGQFDPSDPGAYLEVKKDFRADFAIIAGLPTYYFDMKGGDVPSGTALSILEGRFNENVDGLQRYWETPLADAMLLSLKMSGKVKTGVRLGVGWIDTAARDPLAEAQTQGAKQLAGVSKRQSLREMDYSDVRIDEMEQERADEQKSAGDTMSKLFNSGAVD